MGRPKLRADETATTERLLFAAAEEFADRGFEGARLADIAERAGITRPSLLYHYPSKQELYTAVIHAVFAELGAALAEGTRERGSFLDRFDAVVRRLTAFFDARSDVARLLLREMLDARGPGHALLVEDGVPILQKMERFLRDEGHGLVRADLPLRPAIMQTFVAVVVRTASGPIRDPLWGKTDKARVLARALFLDRPGASNERTDNTES